MKVLVLLCVALFAATVSAKSVDIKDVEQQKLISFISDLYNQVLFPPIDNLAQTLAGLGAQLFAGIAMTGLDGFGKRDLDKSIFNDLYDSIYSMLNNAVMSASYDIAVFLAGIANNGLGKRDVDAKGLFDSLYNTLYPIVNNAVMSASYDIAVFLANIANNGLGKRETKGLLTDLYDAIYPVVNNAVMSTSLSIAISLANIAQNGLGKRDEKGIGSFFSDLYNQVLFPPVDNLAQVLAGLGAQIFAGIAMTGLDGFGKREVDKGVLDFLQTVLGSAVQSNMDTINSLVQDWSLMGAHLLAGMSEVGLSGFGKK